MSGFLGPVAQKVVSLLGMTTLGQKTKATALGVTLASDEDALAVTAAQLPAALGQGTMAQSMTVAVASNQSAVPTSIAAGSDVTEGNTSDAAIDTDTTGTVSGKLRGLVKLMVAYLARFPAALGQAAMAASLPVVVASDQSAVPVTSTQLPAALGQGTMAQSMTVVIANDQSTVPVSAAQLPASLGPKAASASLSVIQAGDDATWAIYRGALVIADAIDSDGGTGTFSKYLTLAAVRGTEGAGTTINTIDLINDYFDGADASMNADPIWFFIPLRAIGYKNYWLNIKNNLGVSFDATLYGALDTGVLFSTGADPERQVTDNRGSVQIATATVTDGSALNLGNGGATQTNQSWWPFTYLILKIAPAGDPAAGAWSLGISLGT